MIQKDLSEIQYQYTAYSDELYQSILRIGFSFPIYVDYRDDKYICIDGHKRLSVLADILKDNPDYQRGAKVSILVKNNNNNRSNDCWRGRNYH